MMKRRIISIISIAAVVLGLLSTVGCEITEEPSEEIYKNAGIEIGDKYIPFDESGNLVYPTGFEPKFEDYWNMTKLAVKEDGRLRMNVGDEASPRYIDMFENSKGTFLMKDKNSESGAHHIQFQLLEGDALFDVKTPLNSKIGETFEVFFKKGEKLDSVVVAGTGFSISMNGDTNGNAEINFYKGMAFFLEDGVKKDTINAGLQMKIDDNGNSKKGELPKEKFESLLSGSPLGQYYDGLDKESKEEIKKGEEWPEEVFPKEVLVAGQGGERSALSEGEQEIANLNNQLNEKKTQLETKENAYNNLYKEYEVIFKKAADEQDKNDDLQKQIADKDREIQLANNAINLAKGNEAEIISRSKQIEELESEKKSLVEQFITQSDDVKVTYGKLQQAENDLINARKDVDNIQKDLKNALSEQEAAYANLLEQAKKEAAAEGNRIAQDMLAKAENDHQAALDKQKQAYDNDINELKRRLDEKDSELASTKSKIDEDTALSAFYEEKAAKLEMERDEAKQQLTQTQTDRDTLNRALDDTKSSLDETRAELSKAVAETAALVQTNSDNTKKLEEYQASLAQLQTKLTEEQANYEEALSKASEDQNVIRNERDTLKQALDDTKSSLGETRAELSKAVAEIATLVQTNSDNTKKLEEYQASLTQLQAKLTEEQANYEEALSKASEDQNAIRKELSQKIEDSIVYSSALEAQLEGAREAYAILEKTLLDELSSDAQEKENLLNLLKKVESDLNERNISYAALEAQLEGAREAYSILEKTLFDELSGDAQDKENLLNLLKKVESDLNERNISYAALEAQNAELAKSLAAAEEKYKDELSNIHKTYSDELAAQNDRIAELEGNNRGNFEEISFLKARVEELKHAQSDIIDEYTAQLKTMSARYEGIISELNHQLESNDSDAYILEQLDIAKAKIAELENEKSQISKELKQQIETLKQELAQRDQALQELDEQFNELIKNSPDPTEIIALREQLETAKQQIAELQAENARLQNSITKLQNFIDTLPPGQRP